MENKYFDITMDEVYDLLTHTKNPWPTSFSKVRKLQLLDNIIDYYTEQEAFEKCAILNTIRMKIMTQTISTRKRSTNAKKT
jgi:hypothetical protein